MIRPLLPSDAEDSDIFAHYKGLKTAQTLVSVPLVAAWSGRAPRLAEGRSLSHPLFVQRFSNDWVRDGLKIFFQSFFFEGLMLQDFTYSFSKIVQIRVCIVCKALSHVFGGEMPR